MLVNLSQNTPQWEEYRKEHFNASEVSDIFGVGFNDELKLAHIKYGQLKPYFNSAMRAGLQEEDGIRRRVEVEVDDVFYPCVVCWDKDNRFSASLDGISFDENTILEIKNSTNEYENIKSGSPSKKYFLQVQQQLMVSGASKCIFAVRNPQTDDISIIDILPNEAVFKEIVDRWNEWEAKYKGKELEPLEQVIDDNSIEATAYKGLVDEYRVLQEQEKKNKARIEEIASELKTLSSGIKTRAFGLLIYPVTRTTYNYKGFIEKSNLEIPPEFITQSTSWQIR